MRKKYINLKFYEKNIAAADNIIGIIQKQVEPVNNLLGYSDEGVLITEYRLGHRNLENKNILSTKNFQTSVDSSNSFNYDLHPSTLFLRYIKKDKTYLRNTVGKTD